MKFVHFHLFFVITPPPRSVTAAAESLTLMIVATLQITILKYAIGYKRWVEEIRLCYS